MNRSIVRVIIENRIEHAFVEAILGERIKAQDVHVEFRYTRGGAIALAKTSLFHQPDQHVALVLNAEASKPWEVEERHARLERILSQAAFEGWHVALTVPNLEAWAVADPRIKAAFESDEGQAKDHTPAHGLVPGIDPISALRCRGPAPRQPRVSHLGRLQRSLDPRSEGSGESRCVR